MMKEMNEIEFSILLRRPVYPLIVVSADRLYGAFSIEQLAESCIKSIPLEQKTNVVAVDSTGEEFWYSMDTYILTPGFAFKKWSKKKIVETYNSYLSSSQADRLYSTKSLSNKRLDKIVTDLCERLA